MWRKENEPVAPAWLRESKDETWANQVANRQSSTMSFGVRMSTQSPLLEEDYGDEPEPPQRTPNTLSTATAYGSIEEERHPSTNVSWLSQPTQAPPSPPPPPPPPPNETPPADNPTSTNVSWLDDNDHTNTNDDNTHNANSDNDEEEALLNNSKPKNPKSKTRAMKIQNTTKRKPCCLSLFSLLTFVAVLSNLLFLSCQIAPLFLIYKHIQDDDTIYAIILRYGLRVYLSIISLFFIVAECEAPLSFVQKSQSFRNWFSRGFLYTFVSMVGMQQSTTLPSYSNNGADDVSWQIQALVLTIVVSEWIMFGVGCMYMLLGICCMNRLKKRLREEFEGAADATGEEYQSMD
mmetsp:Transcript_33541/g.50012  ORF Transcript_33541/g.50012 Transcript_33541/m.50012 type:complete len:348 (-) Transcript_33541:208-1251(-)